MLSRCMLSQPMSLEASVVRCHKPSPYCRLPPREGGCLPRLLFWYGTPATLYFRPLEPVVQDGLNEGWQKLHWVTGRYTKISLIGSVCSPCVIPRTKDMMTVCVKVSASTSFSLDSSCLAGSALAALARSELDVRLNQRPSLAAHPWSPLVLPMLALPMNVSQSWSAT